MSIIFSAFLDGSFNFNKAGTALVMEGIGWWCGVGNVAASRVVRGTSLMLTRRFRVRMSRVATSTSLGSALNLSDLSLISIIILIRGGFNMALANPSLLNIIAFRSFCSLLGQGVGNWEYQRAIK